MAEIPKDPMILLSFVNTKLRDFYPSLEEFCRAEGVGEEELKEKLAAIDYTYDLVQNKFI